MGSALDKLPEEAPDWVYAAVEHLEHNASTVAECTHERSAYSDAAYTVAETYCDHPNNQE